MCVIARIAKPFSDTLKGQPVEFPVMSGSYRPEGSFPAKCTECVCGIENGRGIWCAILKRIPSPKEVKRCRRFCPRVILYDLVDVE
jgi:hypothetical protein